jgi:Flp pilus assembly protein TadG
MVEFALALPLLVIIIAGIIEFGHAIHYHQALTEGVRAGVRYLTRLQNPCTATAMDQAVGLVVTRSINWSNPPMFPDWPANSGAWRSDPRFQASLQGCDQATGKVTGNTLTMTVQFLYVDASSMLRIIGWGSQQVGALDGIPMTAVHQERYIGI